MRAMDTPRRRHALKKAAKRAGRTGIICIDDDAKLGELCIWLLQNPARRSILNRTLRSEVSYLIHNLLWMEYYNEDPLLKAAWPLEAFCVKKPNDRWFLDIKSFQKHLYETKPQGELLRSLLIVLCVFAMLQRDDAKEIANVLLVYDADLATDLLLTRANQPCEQQLTTDHSFDGGVITNGKPDADYKMHDDPPETHESETASAISANESELLKGFEITRIWIQEGQNRVDAFFTAQTKMTARIAEFGRMLSDFPLDDETALNRWMSPLNELVQAASKVDSWIDDWTPPLQHLLSTSELPLPPEVTGLHALASQKRSTIGEMNERCRELRQNLDSLGKFTGELGATLQSLLARLRSHEADLQQPSRFAPDSPFPPDDLVQALRLRGELAVREEDARQKRDQILRGRRDALTIRLAEIRDILPGGGDDLQDRWRSIESSLARVAMLSAVTACEEAYESLRKQIESIQALPSLDDLTQQAIQQQGTPASVFAVVRLLLDQGRTEVATTLLTLLQEGREAEAMDDLDVGEFASLWMEACAGLARTPALRHAWIQVLFCSPWLANVNAGDIPGEVLRHRLAAAFLVLHRFADSSANMGLFYALQLNASAFPGDLPNCNRLLRSVVNREPIALTSVRVQDETARIEQEVAAFFRKNHRGEYVRQAAHGNAVAEMERDSLFPAMENLWQRVLALCKRADFEGARALGDTCNDIVDQAFRDHSLSTTESPFYRKQIFDPHHGYLADFQEPLGRFIDVCAEIHHAQPRKQEPVLVLELAAELQSVAGQDRSGAGFWATVLASLTAEETEQGVCLPTPAHPLHPLLDHCADAIAVVPDLVVAYCAAGRRYRPRSQDLIASLSELTNSQKEHVITLLRQRGCYRHAKLLLDAGSSNTEAISREELLTSLDHLVADRRHELFARCRNLCQPEAQSESDVAVEISLGHFSCADQWLVGHERARQEDLSHRREDLLDSLHLLRRQVEELEQTILKSAADHGWVTAVLDRAAGLRNRVQLIVREVQLGADELPDLDRFKRSVVALQFVVENRSLGFSEFDELIPRAKEIAELMPVPDVASEEHNANIPAGLQHAWETLTQLETANADILREPWGRLANEFARMCSLYQDINTTLLPTGIKGYLHCYDTRFRVPRSRWLDRKISLFLALKAGDWKADWQNLKGHLDGASDSLNIVLVPNGADELRKRWSHNPRRDNYVIIDRSQIVSLANSADQGAPLRQVLHRMAPNLTRIGLFKCEGYVHRQKNLFVGRENAIQQLAQQPASAIWGGRRIGKTSLLHALADRLRMPAYGFKVAYVYADTHESDPDLGLARIIAETLGLEKPRNVSALRTQLLSVCQEQPVAVLIDEIDRYIEASRKHHGEAKFPLARILRGVVQSDSERRFKVVYAGFKQLYHEVRIRPNSDASDPFKNFLEPVTRDFGDLSSDQVECLLKMAFVDMLGIDYEPSVPRLVKEKTSGHPAFVQAFGERLLALISDRSRTNVDRGVLARDVEQVYREESGIVGDHSAYIDYVGETLGWNLSHLGRAIMLALSIDIRQNGKNSNHLESGEFFGSGFAGMKSEAGLELGKF